MLKFDQALLSMIMSIFISFNNIFYLFYMYFNVACFFFPTCQVRVARFYACCPSPPPSPPSPPSPLRLFLLVFADILAVLFARCRQMSPDVNTDLQIAVGSAGPQQRAPDCSGQRRTSTGGLWSGLGNAGPQPGSSGADWATPDLNLGALERTGQRRTSPRDLPSGVGSAGPQLPEDMSEDVSEICQKRMSERMSEDMSEEMSENMSKDMSEEMSDIMSEKMSEEMSGNMSEKNVKRYVRNMSNKNVRRYVRRNAR